MKLRAIAGYCIGNLFLADVNSLPPWCRESLPNKLIVYVFLLHRSTSLAYDRAFQSNLYLKFAGTTPMTYNKKRTVVFVETKLFTQLVKEYLSDVEYGELQQHLMKDPEMGKLIRGGGGVRKVRWAREGMGKSGGVRTIYYWAKLRDQVYMLTMYRKSEKENIDKKTLAQIAKELEDIK